VQSWLPAITLASESILSRRVLQLEY